MASLKRVRTTSTNAWITNAWRQPNAPPPAPKVEAPKLTGDARMDAYLERICRRHCVAGLGF
jgi:hypothetical protein